MASYVVYALKTRREPALNVRLFQSANFSASNILLILCGIITNGAMLMLPLYYQEVRGASALYAGLWLLPQGIGMLLTRSWAGKAADRSGSRTIVLLSLAGIAVGTLPFAFAGTATNYILLAVALLIRGAGLGGLLDCHHGVRLYRTPERADPPREHRHEDFSDHRRSFRVCYSRDRRRTSDGRPCGYRSPCGFQCVRRLVLVGDRLRCSSGDPHAVFSHATKNQGRKRRRRKDDVEILHLNRKCRSGERK
jgi:Arabinose efflux permease